MRRHHLSAERLREYLKDCLDIRPDDGGWNQFANIGLLEDGAYKPEESGRFRGETPYGLGLEEVWLRTRTFAGALALFYRIADRGKFIDAVAKLHGRDRVLAALLELET